MSELIHYDYGQNYAHLDGIKANLNDTIAFREDVQGVFNALGPIYQGQAATALQAAHHQLSQRIDAVIADLQATHQHGVDRQIVTSSLDHHLAGGF